jgi:ATP-dependent protease ClpP protease subunit
MIWSDTPETPKTDEQPPTLNLASAAPSNSDNHIYFYSDVDENHCLTLIKSLRDIDIKLRGERNSRALSSDFPYVPIWLHICSPGGSLFHAFSVADQVKRLETPVWTIVEGYAASAGTILSVSGKKRYILPNAFMIIHQLSSVHWGKYEELKDSMNMLDMAMDNIATLYKDKTKIKPKEIKELLKRDSWFNAKQCIEKGLVDEIS